VVVNKANTTGRKFVDLANQTLACNQPKRRISTIKQTCLVVDIHIFAGLLKSSPLFYHHCTIKNSTGIAA
jgi:hypothetical protein